MRYIVSVLLLTLAIFLPGLAHADRALPDASGDLTTHWAGFLAIAVFCIAYILVILEEVTHLRKSKAVILAGGLVWILVAMAFHSVGRTLEVADLLRHNLLEYAELSLFLMSAMVYISTMEERNLFAALRAKMVSAGLSLRAIFWLTGVAAFFMSPVADNLTTALVMGAVALAVGAGYPVFIAVSCINIVVAANAGGAFSPFGDITTLMVWQKGLVTFGEFFDLFIPSLVSWLVPALCMSVVVPKAVPKAESAIAAVKPGGFVVLALFILTIATTVLLHHIFHLPPFIGMMTGMGGLALFGHFLRQRELVTWTADIQAPAGLKLAEKPFDIFISIKRVEWDTLFFFYGVMLCVGGLAALGYLARVSDFFYGDLGPTAANIMVGFMSAIIDNIPVMFAVLTMNPEMSHAQWLLVTLTAGIGGSLLSIGSAAGVALMGQARGVYTFSSHLRWTWAVVLGYAAGVVAHMLLSGM